MAEPGTLILGGMALLMLLAGGKKKGNGGNGPIIDPNNSDPLPGGSKAGYLPKGQGYGKQIPDDFTPNDLWISDDCQAFVMGQNWLPMVDGLSPYQWMMLPENLENWLGIYEHFAAQNEEMGPDAIVLDFGGTFAARFPAYKLAGNTFGDFYTYAEVGIYPDQISMVSQFTREAVAQASPGAGSCVDSLPAGGGNVTKAQWLQKFQAWRRDYPGFDYLLGLVSLASVDGIQGALDEYVGGMEFGA